MIKLAFLAAALLAASLLTAGEKALMHCFAFTVVPEATESDWTAWEKSTDALPGKIPGLRKVWHGKILRPFGVYSADAATAKKIKPDTTEVEGKFARLRRQHGVCMEFKDEAALNAYAKLPAHDDWLKLYEKVRVEGTTTFDIVGK